MPNISKKWKSFATFYFFATFSKSFKNNIFSRIFLCNAILHIRKNNKERKSDIMENKIIKQGGITYYVRGGYQCYNIDIEPWVTCMQFIAGEPGDEILYMDYLLRDVMKQFTNVTSLVIDADVGDIEISNFMFPNVKLVQSNCWRYKSGKYLIRSSTLLNTFCLDEEDVIDMEDIDSIGVYALAGCRTLNVINVDGVLNYTSDASFTGSMFMINPLTDNRMRLIGKIALNTCTESDTIIVPDDMECVSDIYITDTELADKTLIIHRRETLDALRNSMHIKRLIIKADVSYSDLISSIVACDIKTIELDDHNPYCKIIDNVIYSKNGKVLYRCLPETDGSCIIEEGVEKIHSYAFVGCGKVTSVIIPDTVDTIGSGTFERCFSLKYVKYSKSIGYVPTGCFRGCTKLEHIQCDGSIKDICESAFANCFSLKHLFSLESCEAIHQNAFAGCKELTDVYLPRNITIEEASLPNIINVHLKGIEQLHDLLPAVIVKHGPISVVNIFIDDKHICIPRLVSDKMRKCIFANPENLLNEHDEFKVFQSIIETQKKQEFILTAYKYKKSPLFEGYLKRTAKTIAKRRIEENDEDGLIEILNYDWLSINALEQLLPDIQEAEMNLAIAYVLDKTNNKGNSQSSFRL